MATAQITLLSAGALSLVIGTGLHAQTVTDKPVGILLAVGDIARCGTAQRHLQDERVAQIVEQEVSAASDAGLPIRLLLLGDIAYPNGTAQQFKECFNPSWGNFKNIMLPVPGNHDYGTKDAEPYFSYFEKSPTNKDGEPIVVKSELQGSYSIRFPDELTGSWLLIGLNSYAQGTGTSSRTSWLTRILEENKSVDDNSAACILAFTHPFRFSSGYHGHGSNEADPDAPVVFGGNSVEKVYKLLDEHGADLLVSGHDHHFEQFAAQDVDGNSDAHGLRSFIVGTGGGTLYLSNIGFEYKKQAPNQEAIISDQFGVLKVLLYEGQYSWSFLGAEGNSITPNVYKSQCQSD